MLQRNLPKSKATPLGESLELASNAVVDESGRLLGLLGRASLLHGLMVAPGVPPETASAEAEASQQ